MTITRPPAQGRPAEGGTPATPEVLFREARQRRRRRWIIGTAVLVALAATGIGVGIGTSGPSRGLHPSAAATGTANARGVAGGVLVCTAHQLSVRYIRTGVAMGTASTQFAFVNTGRRCRMRGFPKVQMLTATGANLPTTQKEIDTSVALRPKTVRLAKGGRAYFAIFYPDGTGMTGVSCPESTALRITPPEQRSSIVLRGGHGQIRAYGGNITHPHCGELRLTVVSAHRTPY